MEQPLQCRQDVEPSRKRKRKRRRRCKRHPQEGPHSPTCRGHKTNATNNGPSLVRILPRLKPVLDFLDVKSDVFTRAQIISHLKEYIKKKALYDPADPRKVYCENDQLGEIFGCKEFSTANVCELLLQNLENVPSATNSTEPTCGKRTSRNSTSCCPPCKVACVSTTDTCSCSESDQTSTNELPCSSGSIVPASGLKRSYDNAFSASVDLTGQRPSTSSALVSLPSTSCSQFQDSTNLTEYSKYYQGVCENVTDVVTDTSDDLFFLYETDEERVVRQVDSDEERFSVEYEPISYSEEERLVASGGNREEEELDSGDTEVDEGEDGGDELDTSDSSDSEIEEEDRWQCESCSERNHPMTRRCGRCWAVRHDWYPAGLDRTTSDPGRFRTEIAPIDPATVSDSASTSQIHAPTSQIHAPTVGNVASDSTNHAPSEASDAYGRMRCILCRKEPPNGCIVHGRTGHQVCCVVCARKLKDSNKPCPVCRKKIGKVIKNFM